MQKSQNDSKEARNVTFNKPHWRQSFIPRLNRVEHRE